MSARMLTWLSSALLVIFAYPRCYVIVKIKGIGVTRIDCNDKLAIQCVYVAEGPRQSNKSARS